MFIKLLVSKSTQQISAECLHISDKCVETKIVIVNYFPMNDILWYEFDIFSTYISKL